MDTRQKTEDLTYTLLSDSLLASEMTCESFECGDNNERAKRIGAYLMKDTIRNINIRAGSTASSFMNRLVEHKKASYLKTNMAKQFLMYSSYPNDGASGKDKSEGCCDAKGNWLQVKTSMVVGWEKDKSEELKKLFVWDEMTMKGLERNKANF